MVRKTRPKEGNNETPPDPDAIAQAFMEGELAKDHSKPTTALPGDGLSEPRSVTDPDPLIPGVSSQAEVDAYIASLDAQITEENRLTPFTNRNDRRARELSNSFRLSGGLVQPSEGEGSASQTQGLHFEFPRLGKDKKVRFRAADGSIYEITKKPGGHRITKEGDPAIASISRKEIMERGRAEQWVLAGSDRPDTPAFLSVPDAVVSTSLSPEALERQQQAFTDLQERANHWRQKIVDVKNKREFDTLTSSAAANGSWTVDRSPCFVVGKTFRDILMKNPGIQSDTEIEAVRERARVLQTELEALYLAKRVEMYPPRDKTSATTATSAPAVAPKPAGHVDIAPEPAADPFGAAAVATGDVTQTKGAEAKQSSVAVVDVSSEQEKSMEFGKNDKWVSERDGKRITLTILDQDGENVEVYIDEVGPTTGAYRARTEIVSRTALQERISREGYRQQLPKSEPLPEKSPRVAILPDAESVPVVEGFDRAAHEELLVKLRNEVASERAAFIAVEESQRSAWKNLTRIFRGLSHRESDDTEVAKYRAFYDEKVQILLDTELEKLKHSGKTVKELRPEMAALIREFEFDEAERIYDARQEMRLAKTNQPLLEKMRTLWTEAKEGINGPTAKGEVKAWIRLFVGATSATGSSLVRGIEKGGTAYNKLMRSKAGKFILAASVGTAAVGIATGGVGTAAVGLIALKRLAAGAGIAVTLESISEKIAHARREKRRARVEKDHEDFFDTLENEEDIEIALGNKEKISLANFEKYLKEASAKTRRGEGARRRNELLRKSGAIFAGAVFGSGVAAHFLNGYVGGTSQAHAAPSLEIDHTTPGGNTVSPGAGPETLPGDSLGVGEASKEIPARISPSDGLTIVEFPESTSATLLPDVVTIAEKNAGSLLESHEVKRGESVWKLATRVVKDVPDMDERASDRFAKLVELRLAERLEANPELAREAGFMADADGKFSPHHIQVGAKLELGKLMSQEDLTKLIVEAKSDAVISAPSVPGLDTPIHETVIPASSSAIPSEAELTAREEARIAEKIPPISTEERAAIQATFSEAGSVELVKPEGNVMKYIESLSREDQEKLFRSFKKISVELFQTSEVMGGEAYDMRYDPLVHPELARTQLATILTDHRFLSEHPLTSYDRLKNPLHWSQMEEIVRFAKASAKVLGESVAQPKATESVQEYALRMVATAKDRGVKIPGFRMLN